LRISIAGLGAAAVRGHLPALLRLESEHRAKVVAAADPDASRRAAIASSLPGVPLFTGAPEMLAEVRSELLVVATEPRAHYSLARLGTQHEQHVLCEKPFVLSPEQYADVAAGCAARPDLGMAAVHQYRYSPAWASVAATARFLESAGRRFTLAATVDRPGTDRHARTPWRSDPDESGGMLADHGVHFLALAWTICDELEVVTGSRTALGEVERSAARVRLGRGVLDLSLRGGADCRRTCIDLRSAELRLLWGDASFEVFARGARVMCRRVAALSDRRHVDALYVPLYRELVARAHDQSWWRHRTAEALGVTRALVDLLELAGGPARAA
jgi:predicted dehydrogenase